ncbi:MAG TPA: hypothetical protein VHE11_03580 [Steroidobacteraceae bacterium]|nr:hypothetical protein [Steroidobacteraceae bacterium]
MSWSAENSKAVFAALSQFGAPLEGLTHKDFMEPGNFFRMGTPPVMVDILPNISGVDFDQAWRRRVEHPVESGLNAWFISREDLLAAKLAAGRPQDLADASALGEHLVPSEQPPHEVPSTSDMEEAKQKAVTDWLAYRAQQDAEHGSQTLEERRTQAVEEWKKLQKRKTRGQDGSPNRASEEAQRGRTKRRQKDAAEDPDL